MKYKEIYKTYFDWAEAKSNHAQILLAACDSLFSFVPFEPFGYVGTVNGSWVTTAWQIAEIKIKEKAPQVIFSVR